MAGKGATAREDFAALRTIGEVAEHLDLPQHVLRFWETRFKEIDPVKRAGGRRFYRPRDIELVEAIRHLLYREGYTIKGVQRILKEQGVDAVIADVRLRQTGGAPAPAPPSPTEAPRVEPREATLFDLSTLDPPQPEQPPDPSAAELFLPAEEAPAYPPPVPAPVFNAPVVVARLEDTEQAELLRRALAEIEECRRLLNVTRR
ncbi:MerR family transcriptional regulator [Methylocystis echinoides]|uniref:MerR family transcriptional regulator n=1 Tax=Methylocystis echinoides TaxID=29468 RepID=UPI0034478609